MLDEFGRDGLNEGASRGLDVAISATRRLTALIDDTLLLTRYRAGDLELVLNVESAAEVVGEVLQKYTGQRGSPDQEIEGTAADVDVVVDVDMTASVIGRLIELTVEPTSKVAIVTQVLDDAVSFEVATDAPVEVQRVRTGETAIAAARAVIELHNGALTLSEDGPAKPGSVFIFTLPKAD